MIKPLSFIIAILLMCPLKASCQPGEVMNLTTNKFRNGDTILISKDYKEWSRATRKGIPAMRFYKGGTNKDANVYAVYNWPAVVDKRGLAPGGWHLPAFNELNDSTTTLMRAIKYDSTIIYKNYYEHPMSPGVFVYNKCWLLQPPKQLGFAASLTIVRGGKFIVWKVEEYTDANAVLCVKDE